MLIGEAKNSEVLQSEQRIKIQFQKLEVFYWPQSKNVTLQNISQGKILLLGAHKNSYQAKF